MKNIQKFISRFYLAFIVCAIMTFTTTYFSFALGNANWNILSWGSGSTAGFGALLFLGLIISVVHSRDLTDEREMCVGDIPESYTKKLFSALLVFLSFAFIIFIAIYSPFAIGYASFNPQDWGYWEKVKSYSYSWCALLLFMGFFGTTVTAWKFADKYQKTKLESEPLKDWREDYIDDDEASGQH